ncbi:RING-H2 finger protein ATL56-like [Salvia splendens]|uniref:RING-H2 finger protein ATL56-like n=1 Tax=Salvia splendens TaxID=180675 RepID=UPI001C277A9A|nr:RING-H2 finger protein ATL56-like [Salvia splendens]XP_042003339.1 RING-H2 finger protein ATL56-like [Salvia splendens]
MPESNQHRRAPPPPPRVLSRSQRKLLLFFLKCVIMAVVMSLFLFFLGFAAIVLLNFLFMSNTFTRRRCTRLLRPAPADPEPDFDALLPGVAYRVADSPNSSDCAICLDSFREGESCREIPICRHLFHSNCVDRWIGRKRNCPVCRTRVDLDPPGSPGGDRWKNVWAVNLEESASY